MIVILSALFSLLSFRFRGHYRRSPAYQAEHIFEQGHDWPRSYFGSAGVSHSVFSAGLPAGHQSDARCQAAVT
jgi:hypothetical protein